MAKRRRAIGEGLAALGDTMFQYALQKLEREEREKAAVERQRLQEDHDSANRVREEYLKQNPSALAGALGQRRSFADIASPIAGDISKADSESKALTDEDISGRFDSTGGRRTLSSSNIGGALRPPPRKGDPSTGRLSMTPNPGGQEALDTLIAQGASRRRSLADIASQPDRTVTEIDPSGAQFSRGVNPRTMGRVQTGLSAAQQGANEGAKKIAGDLSPAVTAATVAQQNTVESGTRSEKVRTAGATAGAQARAATEGRLSVEYSPQWVAARIDEAQRKAMVEAAASASRENAIAVVQAADAARVGSMSYEQVKTLWNKVKLGPGLKNDARRAARAVGTATGTLQMVNPVAAELDRRLQSYSMLLYRMYGGTGANVSDKDIAFSQAGLPWSSTTMEVGDALLKQGSLMLVFNPTIKGRYGLLPVEKQLEIVKSWMDLNERAAQAGATQFEDPFKPGSFIQVIK